MCPSGRPDCLSSSKSNSDRRRGIWLREKLLLRPKPNSTAVDTMDHCLVARESQSSHALRSPVQLIGGERGTRNCALPVLAAHHEADTAMW